MDQAQAVDVSPDEIVPVDRTLVAEDSIKKHVIWSMGVGLVPIPFVDLAGVTAVDIAMINQLCKIYEIPFASERAKSIIASLVGAFVPVSLARTAASMLKFIPVVGTTVGVLTMPVASGASTWAIGKVFVQHFESGGTMLTFDAKAMRDYFASELEKGKRIAVGLKK